MINAYVLKHRESRELYTEVYIDSSMQETPMFHSLETAESFRKKLACGVYYETIAIKMTERRYHELSGTR